MFDIKQIISEAKRTQHIERKLFSNTLDKKKIIFEAKGTRLIIRNYFRSEANTSDSKQIIFEAKRLFCTSCWYLFEFGHLRYLEKFAAWTN